MTAVMNPEVQKIQKKYAGKKDQVSLQKQQEEINMVYEKYGVKMCKRMSPVIDAARNPVRSVSCSSEHSRICNKGKKCI